MPMLMRSVITKPMRRGGPDEAVGLGPVKIAPYRMDVAGKKIVYGLLQEVSFCVSGRRQQVPEDKLDVAVQRAVADDAHGPAPGG